MAARKAKARAPGFAWLLTAMLPVTWRGWVVVADGFHPETVLSENDSPWGVITEDDFKGFEDVGLENGKAGVVFDPADDSGYVFTDIMEDALSVRV